MAWNLINDFSFIRLIIVKEAVVDEKSKRYGIQYFNMANTNEKHLSTSIYVCMYVCMYVYRF